MFDLVAAVRAEQARRAGRPQKGVTAPTGAVTRRAPEGPEAVRGAHPSDIVFVGVETFFDRDYSLNTSMLAEFLHDPRFKIHGVAVGFRGRRHWLTEDEFRERAARTPWGRLRVATRNAQLDAAVLAWRFGVAPARWVDTLAMARGAYPQLPDYGLGALAERFGLGRKLDAPAALAGARDLTPAQREDLRRYIDADLDSLERLYAMLAPTYPPSELGLIDRTVRLCSEPCLVLDAGILKDLRADTERRHRDDLQAAGVPPEDLRSTDRFAGHLAALGVEVPRTVSPRTGTERFALSVKDPEFAALRDHPDARVRTLVRARLTAMSSLVVTRAPRMMSLAALGPLAVELNYYGAATGRFSGGGGINLQNLPRDSALRRAICAPAGHLLVGCDSAQIEARVLAWLAREEPLLEAFRAGRDVYCEFASVFFGRPIGKADARERQVGKTAILGLGYGMGAEKFAANLRASGVDLAREEVERLVSTYRKTYPRIASGWRAAEKAVLTGGVAFGRLGLALRDERIALPNGLSLHYPELRREPDGQWRYAGRRGRGTLYGGKIIENLIQALARIVVIDQQQVIAKEFRVVFSVHDEIVCCVPGERAEACRRRLLEAMATLPAWAAELPLACEAAVGRTYGDL